jgi:hypothetical protein
MPDLHEGVGADEAPALVRAETPEERRARWRSVAVSAAATPTRKAENLGQWGRMANWESEHAAAKQLKKAGIVPPTLADAPRMVRELNDK